MKKLLIILLLLGNFSIMNTAYSASSLSGKIFLAVEENGEAWYLNPATDRRYFLGRPDDAFDIMRLSGVGITNDNLNKIPVAQESLTSLGNKDSDGDGFSDKLELERNYNPDGSGALSMDKVFASQQKGKIFLQVENNGEAWYVNPDDGLRYYLGRPQDAFNIMRNLGVGITNKNLEPIPVGDINNLDNDSVTTDRFVSSTVPFTPQAPFGNWADDRQEDGCEEASVLMAMHWARGTTLTLKQALEEIISISEFELERYGYYDDTSTFDTGERIIKEYFNYDNYAYRENIAKEDIVYEVSKGNLVIVPIDGREVANPYYTAPGPLLHMLVIKGYDKNRKVFITNDPGTKRGEGLEYDEDVLFAAINDYPSGAHPYRTENKKTMLVVWK